MLPLCQQVEQDQPALQHQLWAVTPCELLILQLLLLLTWQHQLLLWPQT
jgi:hypothetical protein